MKKDEDHNKGLFLGEHFLLQGMGICNRKMLLFLKTLLASTIPSMLTWLKYCKSLQSIFNAHRLIMRMFKCPRFEDYYG